MIAPSFDQIPPQLRARPQWLLWRFEQIDGEPKPRKVPYYADGGRRVGQQGGDSDRARLARFDQALDRFGAGERFDGIGFAFLPDDGLIGIDLDGVLNAETGEIQPRALEIINAAGSFTEISPSGTGLHIYCAGTTESAKDNGIGVEVFCGRQFFTVTGRHWPGSPPEVTAIAPEVLARIHSLIAAAKDRGRELRRAARPPGSIQPNHGGEPDILTKVRSALAFVSPDLGHNDWLAVGMSIRSELGPSGFAEFNAWSAHGAKYPGNEALQRRWESFPADAGAEPLYRFAIDAGWQPPRRNRGGNAKRPAEARPEHDDREGDDDRAVLRIRPGSISEELDLLERMLASHERVYVYAGQLVALGVTKATTRGKVSRPAGAPQLVEVTAAHMLDLAGQVARVEKWDGRSDGWKPANLPKSHAEALLARQSWPEVRPLAGVIRHPICTPDARVVVATGYDAGTRLHLAFDQSELPGWSVPAAAPTQQQAAEACSRIEERFASMPFVSDADEAASIALLMTAVLRRVLPTAPLGVITAPAAGTGKSMLAEAYNVAASGSRPAVVAVGEKPEEFEKRLAGVLLAGDGTVVLDNIERPVSSDLLCQVATQPEVRLRALGGSAMTSCPTTTSFVLTGNAVVILGDLKRRVVLVQLDARCERPELRRFDRSLLDDIKSHRGAIIHDVLTIALAYLGAGAPDVGAAPIGSFGEWDRMIRRPLIWLGRADPLEPAAELRAVDPELADSESLLRAWHQEFGSTPKVLADVMAQAQAERAMTGEPLAPELRGAISAVTAERMTSKRLAGWLRTHRGRIVGGLRPVQRGTDGHSKAVLWAVEEVS